MPQATAVGTLEYMSPELVAATQPDQQGTEAPAVDGSKADIWAMGCIMYVLLCGYPPFDAGGGPVALKAEIRAAVLDFPSPDWDDVSPMARALLGQMMAAAPADRPTAAELTTTPWLSGQAPDRALHNTISALKAFSARRKLRGAVKGIMAAGRLKDLLGKLVKVADEVG